MSSPAIQYIAVDKLQLLDNNPREITKQQFEKLKVCIHNDPAFFAARPCLVSKEGNTLIVYAGNQRLRAAKSLGWKQIPCIVDEALDIEIMRKRVILDNIHHGQFDYDMLAGHYDINELLSLGMDGDELGESLSDALDTMMDKAQEEHAKCPECGQKVKE